MSPEELDAWRVFSRGSTLVQDQLNQDMEREAGLSVNEFEVLSILAAAPNRRERMSKLADELVHSRSRLTHTVRRLERDRFVKRVKCDDDGRGIYCLLTKSGREKYESSVAIHEQAVRERLFAKLSKAEIGQLSKIFRKVLREAEARRKALNVSYGSDCRGESEDCCLEGIEESSC